MADIRQMLEEMYRDFNARRVEEVLARMVPDVEWPNGWEGGYVHGYAGIRDYWTRQWAVLDPHVEPLNIAADDRGRYVVEVHQVVKDKDGRLLADQVVHHAYTVRNGLIERMEIEP
ncbi:MAG TPA: nuclear transport factor 2 family protein [Terracidiphilus sp.]|jgi:hypothetical protein